MSQGKVENRAELCACRSKLSSSTAMEWLYKGFHVLFNHIFMLNPIAQNPCAYCIQSKTETIMHKSVLETRTAVWSNWRCEGSQGSRATLSTKLRGIVRSSKGGFAVRPFRQVLQLALLSAYYAFSISLMETKTLSAPNIF